MEGDGFSDPRRRMVRRPRGGNRGRGRGSQHSSRAYQRRTTTSIRLQPTPNLGSNEYRFRRIEEDDEENAYDAGVDFGEASSQEIFDPAMNVALKDAVELSNEFSADFSKLESVLASVPLWIRLGEHSRFALGVPDEETEESYLDPVQSDTITTEDVNKLNNEPSEMLLRDLADLTFDNDDRSPQNDDSNARLGRSDEEQGTLQGTTTSRSPGGKATQKVSLEQEEPDDFDKWLDEI